MKFVKRCLYLRWTIDF